MTEILTNISEILNSIQRNLKSPKDLKNSFGNFAYRNAEGILHAFKEEIEKEIYPRNIRIITDFGIELIGNRTFMKCRASIKMADVSEGANAYAELDVTKKGMDQAQLTGAATSYAKKYALCNLLAIDDSKSDPDSGGKPEDTKTDFITQEQGIELVNLAKDASFDLKKVCEVYKITTIIDLPIAKFAEVKNGLIAKKGGK